jgi:hypothetical protein
MHGQGESARGDTMSYIEELLKKQAECETELRQTYPYLSVRAIRILVRYQWLTPQQLLDATDGAKSLWRFKGVGGQTQAELTQWAYGLHVVKVGDRMRICFLHKAPEMEVQP